MYGDAVTGRRNRSGLTLVEVLIAMFLVSIGAVIIYTEMLLAYRILMRSRARLEAQSIAFDHVWDNYNRPQEDLPPLSTHWYTVPTPQWSVMSTNGWVDCFVVTGDTNTVPPVSWKIVVTVWPPTNSPLQVGDKPLARAVMQRWGIYKK
jgi:prepilin-type N-terminal cleavage/methylation domain-containing protein